MRMVHPPHPGDFVKRRVPRPRDRPTQTTSPTRMSGRVAALTSKGVRGIGRFVGVVGAQDEGVAGDVDTLQPTAVRSG